MPIPIKTNRQLLSLVRKNPGRTAKQMISVNNNAITRQNALRGLQRANLNLANIEKDITDTYRLYGNEKLDFNPYWAFGYDYAKAERDAIFNDLTRKNPLASQKVYLPYGRTTINGYEPQILPSLQQLKPVLLSKVNIIPKRTGFVPYEIPKEQPLPELEPLPFKKGGKIHIKKQNRGKFTSWCGGKVTSECIARGKASSNPAIRKRATFAANARKWKH